MWFSYWIKLIIVSLIHLNLKASQFGIVSSLLITTCTLGTVIYFTIVVLEFCGTAAFVTYCANTCGDVPIYSQ